MLNDIFEETRTENSKQLIDFLAKSCEENSNFKNTVITLQENGEPGSSEARSSVVARHVARTPRGT